MKFKNYFRLLLATGIMFAELLHIKTLNTRTYLKPLHIITIRKVNVLGGHINAVLNLANLFQIVGEMQKLVLQRKTLWLQNWSHA